MLMLIATIILMIVPSPSRADVECSRWFPVWQVCEAVPDGSSPRIPPRSTPTSPTPPDDGDDGPGKGGGKGHGHGGHGHGKGKH